MTRPSAPAFRRRRWLPHQKIIRVMGCPDKGRYRHSAGSWPACQGFVKKTEKRRAGEVDGALERASSSGDVIRPEFARAYLTCPTAAGYVPPSRTASSRTCRIHDAQPELGLGKSGLSQRDADVRMDRRRSDGSRKGLQRFAIAATAATADVKTLAGWAPLILRNTPTVPSG